MLRLYAKTMVDGLFIRSLLMAFFFKLFPDIIRDGRLFIAEPPLYKVDDKKNPFVINKEDYIERYVKAVSKDYNLGYREHNKFDDIHFLDKNDWKDFLSETSNYVEDIKILVDHYKVNDRLLELILEEVAIMGFDMDKSSGFEIINKINIQHLMDRIGIEFKELYYDDADGLIKGAINGKYQIIEISEQLIRKAAPLIKIMQKWLPPKDGILVLKDIRTKTENDLSLLEVLKILKKYQPNILHRFKGLITWALLHELLE